MFTASPVATLWPPFKADRQSFQHNEKTTWKIEKDDKG